jgi:hypothetical protein
MKSNELSKNILRLLAVIALGSFLSACAGNASFSTSESSGSIQGYQSIRKPAVGQQWVYNVRDLYNNLVIDTITETVVSVTPVIEIKRESKKHGQLASEIQSNTGLALRDPYWNPPVNFINPMPMWPQSSEKSQTFVTRYKTGEDNVSTYHWSSTITFDGAETLNLDGKQFNTLKSNDWIYFVSNDFSRHTSMRTSTMWLAPEVGRWIIRVTDGSYLDSNTGIGGDRYESRLQYELVSYR